MAEKQIVPDDIFNDAYEKCAQKDRPFYIAGAMNERAKGVWNDSDMVAAMNAAVKLPYTELDKWLEEYKQSKLNL